MQDASYERIEPDRQQSWHFFRRRDVFGYLWHFHPEFELTLITAGSGTRFVGDSVADYQPGDLVLIGANLPHTYASTGPGEAIVCQFAPDFQGTNWTRRPEFRGIGQLLNRARSGLQFTIADPRRWSGLADLAPSRRTLALLDILLDLAERDDGRPLASRGYLPVLDRTSMNRLDALMQFMAANLTRPITLAELAEVACLTPSATSRFFRRQTGTTITAHLNRSRIAHACRALTGSESAIAQVAARSGYANLSHFNRAFLRETGLSPSAFRRQHKTDGQEFSRLA